MNHKCVKDLKKKFGLAKNSRDKLLSNIHNLEDSSLYFISYFNAIQTSWFYFSRWVNEDPKINLKPKELISLWENKQLTEDEKKSWNIIKELRNIDNHDNPIELNFKIKSAILSYNGKILTNNGKILKQNYNILNIDNHEIEYDIIILTKNGLNSFIKLINFVSYYYFPYEIINTNFENDKINIFGIDHIYFINKYRYEMKV